MRRLDYWSNNWSFEKSIRVHHKVLKHFRELTFWQVASHTCGHPQVSLAKKLKLHFNACDS